jgi:HEAT repeat protein
MASSIQEMVARLGNDNSAEVFQAYKEILDLATRATAPGNEIKRAELAAALAAELNAQTPPGKDEKGKEVPPKPKHSREARGKICQLLTCVSGPQEVPALVQAMGDLELREPARCALDRNMSDEATDALIKALDIVGADFRVGLVNSLGKRRGEKVLAALAKIAASDEDPQMRINAVEALANMPEAPAVQAALKATQDPKSCLAVRAWKAAVRLAENLHKAGRKTDAADLYRRINADGPDAQKAAAKMALEAMG